MAKSNIDQFLDHNQQYANGQMIHKPAHPGKQPIQPSKRVAVVACMDARLDVEDLLGLQTGEAPIIRNAGEALDTPRDAKNSERLARDVRRGMSSILDHPRLPTSGPDAVSVRGFIYDVDTGKLDEVNYPGPMGSFA